MIHETGGVPLKLLNISDLRSVAILENTPSHISSSRGPPSVEDRIHHPKIAIAIILRKFFSVGIKAEAAPRFTMTPYRQRETRHVVRRIQDGGLSMILVSSDSNARRRRTPGD